MRLPYPRCECGIGVLCWCCERVLALQMAQSRDPVSMVSQIFAVLEVEVAGDEARRLERV